MPSIAADDSAAAVVAGISARLADAPKHAHPPVPPGHARIDVRRARRLADRPSHEPDASAADAREHVQVQRELLGLLVRPECQRLLCRFSRGWFPFFFTFLIFLGGRKNSGWVCFFLFFFPSSNSFPGAHHRIIQTRRAARGSTSRHRRSSRRTTGCKGPAVAE